MSNNVRLIEAGIASSIGPIVKLWYANTFIYVLEKHTWSPFSGYWHREDGPAQELVSNSQAVSWWWKDTGYSFDEWLKVNDVLSDEEKLMLKLRYGK